jgi:hypothetical protein
VSCGNRHSGTDGLYTTSVAHTLFLAEQYKTAIEARSERAGYYLDAAAWAALGDRKQSIALLRERLNNTSFSKLITALKASLLAILEGKTAEAERIIDDADTSREPEMLVYFVRHYGHMCLLDSSIKALQLAARSGFTCAPDTLRSDPMAGPVAKASETWLTAKQCRGSC